MAGVLPATLRARCARSNLLPANLSNPIVVVPIPAQAQKEKGPNKL